MLELRKNIRSIQNLLPLLGSSLILGFKFVRAQLNKKPLQTTEL